MFFSRQTCRLVLALILALVASACHPRGVPKVGDEITPFVLPDFAGKPVGVPPTPENRLTLLRFWSMDCHFCNKEVLLWLDELYARYKEKGFLPVAIHEGPTGGDDRFRRFEKVRYPMLVDETGKIARRFGVVAFPATVILEGDGTLRDKMFGEVEMDFIETLIKNRLHDEK